MRKAKTMLILACSFSICMTVQAGFGELFNKFKTSKFVQSVKSSVVGKAINSMGTGIFNLGKTTVQGFGNGVNNLMFETSTHANYATVLTSHKGILTIAISQTGGVWSNPYSVNGTLISNNSYTYTDSNNQVYQLYVIDNGNIHNKYVYDGSYLSRFTYSGGLLTAEDVQNNNVGYWMDEIDSYMDMQSV